MTTQLFKVKLNIIN
jgi:hypothetical protein